MGIYSHPWICREYCSLCYICHSFRFNTCSQFCFCHGCFVPSPNNAPLLCCSPVKEHLGSWGWTGASVSTDEVIHNSDYRQTHTNKKDPPVRHPRPWDGILSTWLGTSLSEVPELWAWSFQAVFNEDSLLQRALQNTCLFSQQLWITWFISVNYVSFGLQPPT